MKDGSVLPPGVDALTIRRSLPHGHIAAVLGTLRTIGLDRLLGPAGNRCRDLTLAMIVARLIAPASKLATAKALDPATAVHSLGAVLGLGAVDEDELYTALDWITSLRAPSIRALAEGGALQLGLFDERDMAAITSPDYPDERLIVCRNPELARERRRKREDLLAATEKALAVIQRAVERRHRPLRGPPKSP